MFWTIVGALLFVSFLPYILGISFYILTRDWFWGLVIIGIILLVLASL